MASKMEIRVNKVVPKNRGNACYRGFYLPIAIYRLLNEPDVLVVEELDVKGGRITMRAVKKPKPQTEQTETPHTQTTNAVQEVIQTS